MAQTKPKKARTLLNKEPNVANKKSWSARLPMTTEKIDLRAMFLEEFERRLTSVNKENKHHDRSVEISSLYMIDPHISKLNVPTDERGDKRILILVVFHGKKYDALVDTGETDSCIRRDITTEHVIEIHSIPGVITLADENQTIPRIGRTESIEVQYDDRIVFAPFEIIEKCYPFIIGMDYFHQFGLVISGLANPGDEATRLPEPEQDKKPSIVPGQIPDEEKTSQFIEAKENFMKYIMASLERNAQIPKSSHCPVPEMKVNLLTPEGTVLYRRLRPYAEKQNSILDEAIQQWLKDDVITLAPAGNVHNNTLTLLAKKDKKGEKKPCGGYA